MTSCFLATLFHRYLPIHPFQPIQPFQPLQPFPPFQPLSTPFQPFQPFQPIHPFQPSLPLSALRLLTPVPCFLAPLLAFADFKYSLGLCFVSLRKARLKADLELKPTS